MLDRDDLELYGVEVEVAFVERLRGMVRFDGVEALLETMADDVRRTREVLGARECRRRRTWERETEPWFLRTRAALLRRRRSGREARRGAAAARTLPLLALVALLVGLAVGGALDVVAPRTPPPRRRRRHAGRPAGRCGLRRHRAARPADPGVGAAPDLRQPAASCSRW